MEGIARATTTPARRHQHNHRRHGDAIYQRYMQTIDRPDLACDPERRATRALATPRRIDRRFEEWTILHDPATSHSKCLTRPACHRADITASDICSDEQYEALNMIQR